ncbi:AraC family transcriptional regulator [Oceanispirochaeta crateris]|uniref:AraC family transcriptional regulator n=1 Tax=Oceanispirochaeta crateris TaxID=2518645 RepID=A0A5C1QSK0_9SPIO|nr:helix-turn-helix domain-containing protein [Oceanispirochaeta crateris]QEN08972.1 AraC family transcriptional regulator [Oceanispirochaeta crateris]
MFNALDLLLAMGLAWMVSGICLITLNRDHIVSAHSAIFLLCIFGLTILDNLFRPEILPDPILSGILILTRSSYFLIGPTLYLYTNNLLNQREKRQVEWLHYIPFAIMVIYKVLNPSALYPEDVTSGIPVGTVLDHILDLMAIVSRVLYSIFVIDMIRRHKSTVTDFYSSKTYRNTLSWLYYLVIFYLGLFLFNFIILLFPPSAHSFHQTTALIIRIFPALLFIFLYSLFAHNQSEIESYGDYLNRGKTKSEETREKYKSSNLSPRETHRIYEQLNFHINQNSLHTDPDLTLRTLSEKMGITTHHLSESINKESGNNFYGYINGLRIKEFLKAVKEDKFPSFTITGIALECGFKSITAFYTNFKKEMGMTPKEFIKGLEKNETSR